MSYRIPFNRPYVAGKELYYIAHAVTNGHIAADGFYAQQCTGLLEQRFGVHRAMLTPSCTAALEIAVMLCDLGPGDEVILPSYTFVSTATAVTRAHARPVFVDIRPDTLNLDETLIEAAITSKTRAIMPVHYAGVGCAMDAIMDIARRHKLRVIEDAAQGVNASFAGRALGSIGDLGAYSFHETKNYICGEGGALCVNDPELVRRAEVIRDKGTNRREFFRGEVDKYTWVAEGSSYVIGEVTAAFLWAQLEQLDELASRRAAIYARYQELLGPLEQRERVRLPRIPEQCASNHHIFYVIVPTNELCVALARHLKEHGILAVSHYVPLHSSPMGKKFGYEAHDLPVTEDLSARLLRLPFFYELSPENQVEIADRITEFAKRW